MMAAQVFHHCSRKKKLTYSDIGFEEKLVDGADNENVSKIDGEDEVDGYFTVVWDEFIDPFSTGCCNLPENRWTVR